VSNEVSIVIGYPFKPNTEATAVVGSASFALYTQQDGAWIKNVSEEARLIDALRSGQSAVVKGVSVKGTQSTDTFSLKGFRRLSIAPTRSANREGNSVQMVRRRRRDVGPATRSAQTLKLPHAAAPQKTPRGGPQRNGEAIDLSVERYAAHLSLSTSLRLRTAK
jgi:hypothetical protein